MQNGNAFLKEKAVIAAMGYQWEIFDPIDEYVYATDPETYALRYMNPALKKALQMEGEYRGQKCYEVLEGRKTPCAVCKHSPLREGKTLTSTYYHPLQQRQYDLSHSLVQDGDERFRLMVCRPTGGATAWTESAHEHLLQECLNESLGSDDFDEILDRALAFIGMRFFCARSYIFEIGENERVSNTYEWCAPGVEPQKDFLQDEPIEVIETWMQSFRQDKPLVLPDVEAIREEDPALYATLKPQGIDNLVCFPLRHHGEIMGFVGLDNPVQREFPVIIAFLRLIEHFFVSWIKHRDVRRELRRITHHDPLTGAFNRRAFRRDVTGEPWAESYGVLHCNLLYMRNVDSRKALAESDEPVLRCFRLLEGYFADARIYRLGYHEFALVCPDTNPARMEEGKRSLLRIFADAETQVAIGVAWGRAEDTDIVSLTGRAAAEARAASPAFHRAAVPDVPEAATESATLQEYLRSNPVASELLVEAVSEPGSPVGLFLGDMAANRYYITNNIRTTFDFEGSAVENLLERWAERICTEEDREIYLSDLTRVQDQQAEDHDFKYRVFTASGESIWVHSRAVISYGEDGAPRYAAGFVTRQESAFDPITSFPGKEEALKRLQSLADGRQGTFVLGIGLNNFSEINEAIGRSAADILLRDIAGEWERRLGRKVWFYRLDGVRFAAIVNPVCTDKLPDLAAELRKAVLMHCTKQRVALEYPCSICAFRYSVGELWEAEELFNTLITFIDVSKSDRAKPFVLYSEEEKDLHKSRAELLLYLNEDVRAGYRNFRIVVQPIVDAPTGNVMGGEVLLRWRHDGKDVSPGVFVPLLEKSGLIKQVGRWVFERAVQQCYRISGVYDSFHLSCNVSYFQLSDNGFVPFMKRTIQKYGLGHTEGREGVHLIMELTETHFDEQPELLRAFVNACRELGVRVALDDFGSGYSSLSLLMKYPVDIVKLDRAILREMSDAVEKRKFIKTLVFACHELGRTVCVEGVETAEDLTIVQDTGGDLAQGFYFHRPLELEDFYRTLYLGR